MKNLVLLSAVAVVATLVSAPAWSDDTAKSDDAGKSKVVCKSETVVGTRLPQRVCKTQAQIEEEKQNGKEATDAFQHDGSLQREKGS